MSAVEDVQGLLQEPHFPSAVQWSDDNLIAVASGASAVILNPCNLAGPRALLPTDGIGLERPPHSDLVPPDDHLVGQLLRLCGDGARGHQAWVRAVAWAPAGSAPGGGSLLTALYDNGNVRPAGREPANGTACSSSCLRATHGVRRHIHPRPAAPPDLQLLPLCTAPLLYGSQHMRPVLTASLPACSCASSLRRCGCRASGSRRRTCAPTWRTTSTRRAGRRV